MVKPSRSDPEEDQGIREWQQSQEAASAPLKRPSYKPSRSEPAENLPEASSERLAWRHQELLSLVSQQTKPLETTTSVEAADDYTESDYYEGIRAVNKEHHHTTGTGLIKVRDEPASFHYLSRPVLIPPNAPVKGKSNPAMNDWVPEPHIVPAKSTSKPSRSESNVDV